VTFGNSPSIPAELYGLHEPRPSLEKDDEQEVFYTTALTPEMANGHLHNAQPVSGRRRVCHVRYEGLGTGVQEFILTVYGTCMPMLNLTRRKGQDIERFYPEENAGIKSTPIHMRCEYLIPIRR
jgi:AraC family transcriptional activator of mar-sox-rob regulon